jgi:micrococcal nuclease
MAGVANTHATFRAAAAGMMIMLAVGGAGASEADRLLGPLPVAEVLAGDLIRLADGRPVRLAGIRVARGDAADPNAGRFAEKAHAALRRLLDGQTVALAPAEAPYDRYGRLVAQVERSARAAGRGLWADPAFAPQEASALRDGWGRFRIVRGTVVRIAPTESYVYLNFGADWRTDFTVRVRRAELEGALSGIDLEGLAGRVVEVRGVVLEAGGPLIELSHPEQLQVSP